MSSPRIQHASNHRRVPVELRHLLETQGPQFLLEKGDTDPGNKQPPLETRVLPQAAHTFSPDSSMLCRRCDCLSPVVPGQPRMCLLPTLHGAQHWKSPCRKLSSFPRDTLHLGEGLHRWVLPFRLSLPKCSEIEDFVCAIERQVLSLFCSAFCLITTLVAIMFGSFFLNTEHLKPPLLLDVKGVKNCVPAILLRRENTTLCGRPTFTPLTPRPVSAFLNRASLMGLTFLNVTSDR